MNTSIFLKIKIKTLAEEARFIRREEKRHIGSMQEQLHWHRIGRVRQAARNTHLAYSYIRGRAYHTVERTSHTSPNWKEVERMVNRYGGGTKFDKDWYKPAHK
jgi:hypothetical protein